MCTACIEGRRAGPRALLHALHHYALRVKIILADFNLAVSTPTAKPPNLIPRQIFRLYGTLVGSNKGSANQFCQDMLGSREMHRRCVTRFVIFGGD